MTGLGKALSFDGTNDYATLPIGNLMSTLSEHHDRHVGRTAPARGGSWQRMFDFGSGTSVLRCS